MRLKNLSSISEAVDLQYKAIMTLYKYTDDLKKTTNEILGNMNDIVGDTEINKMNIISLQNRIDTINKVQLLQNENTNLLLDRISDLSSNLNELSKKSLQLANSVLDIKKNHNNHNFYNTCDFFILLTAIITVYFIK